LIRVRESRLILLMPDVCHETIYFEGRVQGVGFRYQTLQLAREFEVAGFVRNLADGRVQVEMEGAETELAAFVVALNERMAGYIKKMERSADPIFGLRDPMTPAQVPAIRAESLVKDYVTT
jgi:acylphosphatase